MATDTSRPSDGRTPRQPDAGTDAGVRFLAEAVDLTRRCVGYWRDERLRGRRRLIDYAIDVDVMVMFSAPAAHGAIARTFTSSPPGVDDELPALLARCLSDYIFWRLAQDDTTKSFALLPPHDREWTRVSIAIAGDVAAEASAAEVHIDALAGLEALDTTAKAVAYLSANATQVLAVLDGAAGAAAQVARLNALPRGRIVRLGRHPAFNAPGTGLQPPPEREGDAGFTKLQALADDWYEAMLPFREGSTRLQNVEDDAWALARLHWINEQAVQQGGERRLVLITSTERLFKAAAGFASLHDATLTFADDYLRHPLSFLGAKDFFASDRANGEHDMFRLRSWLRVLFPDLVTERQVVPDSTDPQASRIEVSLDEAAIEAILKLSGETLASIRARHRDNGDAPFPGGALRDWAGVVRATALRSDMSLSRTGRSDRWSHWLLDRLAAAGSAEEKKAWVREALFARVQNAFIDLYRSIDELGTVQALREGQQMRGLPALRFDLSLDGDALAQYDELCRSLWEQRPREFDIGSLYQALAVTDPSNYRATLIHALICASSDLWFQTRTLCRIAVLIATSPTESARGTRDGREAYYLLAVAERRLATVPASLDLARAALRAARQPGRLAGGDDDIRFRSEDLAQDVFALQYQRYVERSPQALSPATVLRLIEQARTLCKDARAEPLPTISSWVIRQAATNGAIVGLMAHAEGLRSPQMIGAVRVLLGALAERALSPALLPEDAQVPRWRDDISDFVFLAATAVFHTGADARESARLQLKARTQERAAQGLPTARHSEFVYEASRTAEFLRIAGADD